MELTLTRNKKPKEPLVNADGTTGPTYDWPNPAKPSALLVPRYVIDNRALAKTKKKVIAGVMAAGVAAAVAVAGAFVVNMQSQSELADAEAARDAAQVKVDALAHIAAYYDGLSARRDATLEHLSRDVTHAAMLDTVLAALPEGADLTSYETATGDQCPGPDPFEATAALGCIEMSATAPSEETLPEFLRNLKQDADQDPLLVAAFAANVSGKPVAAETVGGAEAQDPYAFTATINFTPAALSLKYVPEDQIEAVQEQAATEDADTTEPAPTENEETP